MTNKTMKMSFFIYLLLNRDEIAQGHLASPIKPIRVGSLDEG